MGEPNLNFPSVSIIIPVFNGERYIGKCIEHLKKQSYPGKKIEILVMDDGSRDSTLEIVRAYGIRCICSSNSGPSKARNEGMRLASGEILLFLDADCMADKHWVLYHVLSHLYYQLTDPKVQIIGGGIAGENPNYWACCDDFCSWFNQHPGLPSREVPCHPTANMSITSEAAANLQFDEELRFSEDYAFCTEAARRGLKISFNPKAVIFHKNRTSYKSFMKHARDWASSQQLLLEKGMVQSVCRFRFLGMHAYILGVTLRNMLEILYSCFKANRLNVLLCLPFIFFNKFYSNYYMFKPRWKYFKSQERV